MVDDFDTVLHKLVDMCDYEAPMDDLLHDRFVVGLRDSGLSKKLQLDSTLTVDKALATTC